MNPTQHPPSVHPSNQQRCRYMTNSPPATCPHLTCISPVCCLYLACIPPTSRLHLPSPGRTPRILFNSIALPHSRAPLQFHRPAAHQGSSSNPAPCHTPRRLTFNGPPHKAIAQALLKSWYAISGCAAQNAEQCRGLHCKPGVRSSIPAPYRTPRLITSNGPPHKALAQALLKS